MPTAEKPIATRLKLPAELKRFIHEDARRTGVSSHAYMVNTRQNAVSRVSLQAQFTQHAMAAEQDMLARGAHDWAEVREYFAARQRGENPARPSLHPVAR